MKAIITVLTKTIVWQFYRQNAGLLAVVFLIAGSFLRAIEHITLAQVAVHSLFIFAFYLAIWALYTLHATRFFVRAIRQHTILYHARLLPRRIRLTGLYITQLQLLLPVLMYAGFMLVISLQEKTHTASLLLISSVLMLSALPLSWIHYTLLAPNPERAVTRLTTQFGQRLTTPYGLFFIRYLLQHQPILLLLTKVGTLLLTVGILLLYPTDSYDIRLLGLGMVFVAVGHVAVVYQLYQFEHERLTLYRNLPVSLFQRLLRYVFLLGILFLPEGLILIRNAPADLSVFALVSVWMFGHSVLLLQFTSLLKQFRPLDKFLPTLFWFSIGGFFFIMYRIPLWCLAFCGWGVGSWLFFTYYWKSVWEVD